MDSQEKDDRVDCSAATRDTICGVLGAKDQIDASLRAKIFNDIDEVSIEAELLIFGFPPADALHPSAIFKMAWNEIEGSRHFACIGAGASAAEQALHSREQRDSYEVMQSLYNVYEAKRFAELAPSVGRKTHLMVMEPFNPSSDNKGFEIVTQAGVAVLEENYKRLGPKPVDKIEIPEGVKMFG